MNVAQSTQPGAPARKKSELFGFEGALLTTVVGLVIPPSETVVFEKPYCPRTGPSAKSASMKPTWRLPRLSVSDHGNHWSLSGRRSKWAISRPLPASPAPQPLLTSPPTHVVPPSSENA